MPDIHPTAVLAEDIVLGTDVVIGPYCVIGPQVELGSGCVLHSHVVIQRDTRMGAGNQLYPFSMLGGDPQDLKYKGEQTWLIIGDRNVFREGAYVHRGTADSDTRIGNDNLLMGHVHVAHDCHIGNANVLSQYAGLSGHVQVQDHTIIGGKVGVQQFKCIGSHAYIGGSTRVAQSIPPYTACRGNPLEINGINVIGMRRFGIPRANIQAVQQAYKHFFRSGLPRRQALEDLEKPTDFPEARQFAEFLREFGFAE